ncbi:MAG: nitroreductase [Deltaproteobacteria bacterium]|nr:nitroreductase [Deltaproteobacteria bacterium]
MQVDTRKKSKPDIGMRFQNETKYTPESLAGHTLDFGSIPATFKEYSNPILRIPLPEPKAKGETNIWKLLLKRRSRREYSADRPLTLNDLSALLWATQGLTAQFADTFFRTAPSAGALYPVETYLSVRAVDGLEEGIYHFRPGDYDLELIKKGNFSVKLAEAALQQSVVLDAQVTFIWSSIIARGRWKYNQRAYRYIYLDAGHIAQNLYLAGEGLGLGICAIGAFYDDDINEIMGFDGEEETIIYMATVGFRSPDHPIQT